MRCICLATLFPLLAVLPATALAQTSGGPTVELPPESQVVRILNGPTSFGANEGGRHRTVSEGDAIIIPAGVFHGWIDIEDHVTYLSVRPDPDKVLPAGYVNPVVEP